MDHSTKDFVMAFASLTEFSLCILDLIKHAIFICVECYATNLQIFPKFALSKKNQPKTI